MEWFDGHLDLAYLTVAGRDLTRPLSPGQDGCITLPDLAAGAVRGALATIFTESGAAADDPGGYRDAQDVDGAEAAGLRQLAVYQALERAGHLVIARAADDLSRPAPFRIVLLMEGADPIRSPEEAAAWVERGVRVVGLTWARGSRYAGGNAAPHGPLTRLGGELVDELDRLGVTHDLSHLSDQAAEGLLSRATGRVVATHSNARLLMPGAEALNQRHLSNEFAREIAARDGIIGLNLFSRFLAVGRRAMIDDCLRHLDHLAAQTGSRRYLALGSDMDGGFSASNLPVDLDHPTKLGALATALNRAGWSEEEITGFAHANWERFLRTTLPA